MGAMPMVEISTPKAAPVIPLRKDPAARLEMMVRPKISDPEIFGRAELEGDFGQGRAQENQGDDSDQAAERRADGGADNGLFSPPLLGHGIAVEGGADRTWRAGGVDQDGAEAPP